MQKIKYIMYMIIVSPCAYADHPINEYKIPFDEFFKRITEVREALRADRDGADVRRVSGVEDR